MLERIHELGLEGDPVFIVELIDSYAPLFENQFRAIREACVLRDAVKLHHAAHSIKGAALNIGANELAARCSTMEDMGEQENIEAAEKLLGNLKEGLDTTLASLASIKVRVSSPKSSI